jgi:Cof subfamily protein (haloacid dehalogenase superfamily)
VTRRSAAAIGLIAIDVDGTLLDSRGRIPDANLAAIAAAVARGIAVVVATGRSFSFALPAVALLADPLLLIVHNGAIARERTGETLVRRLLPREHARAVLAATAEWRASTLAYFDRPRDGQIVTDRLDWTHPNRARFRQRNQDIIAEVSALEDALSEDPIQLAFNGELMAMRDVVGVLSRHPAAGELSISVTEYPQRDFSLVDVCGAGTTKGQTLSRVAAALGIAREQVMAVGDNHNDRDMLEWAGVGVVMGNAAEELRHAGFERTGTNDEAGLAAAIRAWAL